MLTDLKELEKFLKVCRKQGVTEITFDNVIVKFGDLPTSKSISSSDDQEEIPTDALSAEQLMFYAVDQAGPL